MKFKYTLGERVLFNLANKESIGTVTAIVWRTTGVKYVLNDGPTLEDSDILGTVTVKRAAAPRNRKKKISETDKTTPEQADSEVKPVLETEIGPNYHLNGINGQ